MVSSSRVRPSKSSKPKSAKPKSLSHGRPPTFRPPPSLSAKATRTLIRSHHQLHKALSAAQKAGDGTRAREIETQIAAQGGLEKYQRASMTGQSGERGGDSSRVLVGWLGELDSSLAGTAGEGAASAGEGASSASTTTASSTAQTPMQPEKKYTTLEVGALSTTNAISKTRYLAVTRIDLHSQAPGIAQQDFMQRPLPASDADRFDVLSLSLVLNYVPSAEGRGEMLRRTCAFLRPPRRRACGAVGGGAGEGRERERGSSTPLPFPCLFLVLPAPCVVNSRYLDEERLGGIMRSLGYDMLRRKETAKLVYYLWRWGGEVGGQGERERARERFGKVEIRPGGKRNNFCVVLG